MARPGQPCNRVVDVSITIEQKIVSLVECKPQGGGNSGSQLRSRLAKEGRRLPLLGDKDETAIREYVRNFFLSESKKVGREHGLEYVEAFYYTDQQTPQGQSELDRYIEKKRCSEIEKSRT